MQDHDIKEILQNTRVIALVGASANAARPSHQVMHYLQQAGYRVLPVNPGLAGQVLLGETVYASVTDLPDTVDMVDVFRQPSAVPGIVDQVLAHLPAVRCIWLQLGITHPQAAATAQAQGLTVVQDRCTKIEHARLM